jgi:hypothetical protein
MSESKEARKEYMEPLSELLATDIDLLNKPQLEELLGKLTTRISEVKESSEQAEYENAVQAGKMVDQIRKKLEL